MQLLNFMNSPAGRITKGVVGAAGVAGGAALGSWGWVLAGVGAVLLVTAIFDACPLSALWGKPVSGKKFRAAAAEA
ncbi:MAG: DUF2892 domain-containing protein [Ancrocorticia sp.]|jgi:hypothetical protein|nr:DUF2892 domain-containing protein [Ancrocorticia sp.]MCI1963115.1 DUF2892 domain-containing protein [Ancrocorticia sp.]MCI2001483.1 DUF2892 domain-containing protein [Ancrocorticia sp.]MCI2013363.1 DUF2892 domain-containing protein [Ancrocorticia sp.]MCI2029971.1 DUF2892 domain-containing protein [Ancrocorticia sp.]